MLKTTSPIDLLNILQSIINMVNKNKVGGGKIGCKTNLSNPSVSKKSTKTCYLTSGGAKRGGGNTKKDVKAAKGSNYLTSDAKKVFNYLRHPFI